MSEEEKKLRTPIVAVLGHVDHGKCLAPDEFIISPELGKITLRDLFELGGEVVISNGVEEVRRLNILVQSLNGRLKFEKTRTLYVWRIRHRGKIIRVKLKNWHDIKVTPEHPFLTKNGWKRSEDLKPGDLVAIPRKIYANEDLNLFIRHLTSYIPEISEHRNDLDFLKAMFYLVGLTVADGDVLKKMDGSVCNESYLQSICSINERGVLSKIVFLAPKEIVSEFLRGFFNRKGNVNVALKRIEVSDKSEDLIKDISLLLLRFGITSRIHCKKDGEFILEISGRRNLEVYMKSIGFSVDEKVRDLKSAIDSCYDEMCCDEEGSLEFIEVEEIEEIEYDGYVYDISTRTKNFVANGIVVHNTTLLDKIRKTRVAMKEAGGITQHIGATEIPISIIREICKDYLKKIKITIPGLLFIDTPGHRAFTNLRKRGGALADLAVLVIDINEGFKPQTEEAISILRTFKTPFVVAANKIDKIPGWQSMKDTPFLKSYALQDDYAKRNLENKIYELIGELYRHKFNADRFDRIRDFTRTVAIIPTSAITGEGIPELLMVLAGLAQKYLEKSLRLRVKGKARGTVLEVKEEKGLGISCDVILYDGTLKVGDTIAIAGIDDVIVTRVKAILKPRPAQEMRVESKFRSVKSVTAAAGVKIVASNLENVLAGSEFEVVESEDDIRKFRERVRREYEEIAIRTDEEGVVLKTDTLGSLEALINELKRFNIPIKKAEVGDVDKRDVVDASTNKDELNKVVLAFNVKILSGVEEEARKYGVNVFCDNVIYSLIDNFVKWREETRELRERKRIEALIKPAKIKLLKEYIFRRSKPAIIGVRVLAGEIRKDLELMREDGKKVGRIRSIQKEGKSISVAREGEEVAIAIDGVMIGRQIDGDEVLYIDIPEAHAKIFERELFDVLSDNTKKALKEFLEIKRKENPFWAR